MQRQSKGPDPDLFTPIGGNGSNPMHGNTIGYGNAKAHAVREPNLYEHPLQSNQRVQADRSSIIIELEHMSGFTGKGYSTLHAHPLDGDSYLTWLVPNVTFY